MKTSSLLNSVITVLLLTFMFGCKKDKIAPIIPTVTLLTVTSSTPTSALSGGEIVSDGGAEITSKGICWSTNQNPTINDSKISIGPGSGKFTANMAGLNAGYTYYFRAYATNKIGTSYSQQQSITTILADIDGNVYTTVKIGTQVWMVQNLKTTKYRNGDPVTNITDITTWEKAVTGAYCWNNNNISYKGSYGALYNWYAVTDSRNLAPAGWHIPTGPEWDVLVNYTATHTGGPINNGNKLRESGTSHWQSPNTGATNESGFTALPGGGMEMALYFKGFSTPGATGLWWSKTPDQPGQAKSIIASKDLFGLGYLGMNWGLSVRCLRD